MYLCSNNFNKNQAKAGFGVFIFCDSDNNGTHLSTHKQTYDSVLQMLAVGLAT